MYAYAIYHRRRKFFNIKGVGGASPARSTSILGGGGGGGVGKHTYTYACTHICMHPHYIYIYTSVCISKIKKVIMSG